MSEDHLTADVLVVGSGIAGCAAALAAAREVSEGRRPSEKRAADGREHADVLVVTKAERPEDASTDWAQGGIATTRNDAEQFKRDVIDASAGTADPDAVDVLVEDADTAVEDVLLDTLDVGFDTSDDANGVADETGETGEEFDYAREAAHSAERILHVDASTGTHILRPFLQYLDDHERVTILEDTAALDLLTHEGRVHGAQLDRTPSGERAPTGYPVFAGATVLATGGIGSLYPRSTNPAGSTGDGVAMAALAGADVEDMEYVQFHPTAFDPDADAERGDAADGDADGETTFLLSEAVRGEGALLRNAEGERFMPEYHEDAELAPRDVVARAVDREREATGEVVLDVEPVDFEREFPDLAAECEARGVDWTEGIPVAPCEHFLCGGVAVDDRGRTSLDRLFAVGECARTGVHGANRLASTSLLEGLVWGLRAGEASVGAEPEPIEAPDLLDSDPALPDRFAAEKFTRLRRVMDERVGLRRDSDGLRRAAAVLRRLKGEVDAYVRTRTARDLYELRNASVTALLIARAAAENPESVGCHYLDDADAPEATTRAGAGD
ncbi:L-aspartate oxidase [Natronoarchaeum philippinense]|uniref:L-aspartate oxidase n=1 Tax=Natronoarchaeum philippinense TaxID=558529 RepID=A0A285NBC7_NATPI|nr:FAD-binding protein [Natronoarchaeum philippinense]SNZ06730.1 L-aspartate oxidase [Natronoarchaeum philippinense]